MNRRLLFSLALWFVLAGCATVPQPALTPTRTPAPPTVTPAPAGPAARQDAALWLISGTGPAARYVAVDLVTGKVARSLPLGVADSAWKSLYTVETNGNSTAVRAFDLATGAQLRALTFGGAYALPQASGGGLGYSGLSSDGSTLVLTEIVLASQAQAFNQSGQWISRFAILNTALNEPPQIAALPGRFEYDTLGPNGQMLYLIERQTPEQPTQYRVRAYNVAERALLPGVVVDKSSDEAVMDGYAGQQVSVPGGEWVFTLYRNESYGPFVHALNAANQYAICIDLPKEGKENQAAGYNWALVRNPVGGKLYAVNTMLGQIAEIDASNLRVSRTATLPAAPASSRGPLTWLHDWLFPAAEAKELGPAAAAVAPDGRTLYVATVSGLAVLHFDAGH